MARYTALSVDPDIAGSHDGRSAVTIRPSLYRASMKRIVDVLIVLFSAIATLPLILIGALLVALDGHNPFYSQIRVGRGGKPFRMWKLRTMVPDADSALERFLASCDESRAEWDATQKLKNDPRITRIGRFLRKTSIDELPQVWNVFTGQMSIVGPRPMLLAQRALYPGHAYYRLRPGITGFWQISGRNETEFRHRAVHDAEYDRRLSLGTDLAVILGTVRVVVRGTGY